MNLKDYTTEELREELKRRNAEERAKKASILRCRMRKHWGQINYWVNLLIIIVAPHDLANSSRQRTESIINATGHHNLLVNTLKERRNNYVQRFGN